MPASTGETSEPQHIEDAYSGKLNYYIVCVSSCFVAY